MVYLAIKWVDLSIAMLNNNQMVYMIYIYMIYIYIYDIYIYTHYPLLSIGYNVCHGMFFWLVVSNHPEKYESQWEG